MPLTARRALGVLIVVSAGLRLVWAGTLDVGNDEAYHYLYAVHPAWSYFDHPPMTMWLEWPAVALLGPDVSPLALRLSFILLFAGSTWVLFRWTARWYGQWAGFYAALALNLTAYYTAAAGAFVLPDGPLLFFSLLTLWALSEALVAQPGKLWPWLLVGLAWAGALLSKYHAVFLPAGALLYVVITPTARRSLLAPGPYLAVAVGALGFLPVLVWNAQNEWASFTFQAERAVGMRFRPASLLKTVGGQAFYLFPWRWVELILVLAAVVKVGRRSAGLDRLLACQAVVPLTFFLAVSCVRDNLPHWSLLGFVPLFPVLGARWAGVADAAPRWMRRRLAVEIVVTLLVAGLGAAQARLGLIPMSKDPTFDMSGWPSVAAGLEERGLLDRPNSFLFTDRWYYSGHLAFAVRDRVPVLCYNSADARGFMFWSRPEDWVGMDGYLVTVDGKGDEPLGYEFFFERVELVAEFPMTRDGRAIRTVRVYHCARQRHPFPFIPEKPGK